MIITVHEVGAERYVVDVPSDATVEKLLQAIGAVRTTINVADMTLEFPEGKAITTGPLSAAGLIDGSVVFLKQNDSVAADEMANTIIVTNIPVADKTVTENAVVEFFSSCGDIKRLILHGDGDNVYQHAVIVFATPEAATVSLKYSGSSLLNGTISVVSAGALPNEPGHGRANNVVSSVAKMFAGGYSTAKGFDEQHKISLSVKSAAEVAKLKAKELDSHLKVTEKLAEVDEKFHVKERATKAAGFALGTAEKAAKTAMAYPGVSTGVKKLSGLFSSMATMAGQAMDEVKTQIKVEEEKRVGKSPSNSITSDPTAAAAPPVAAPMESSTVPVSAIPVAAPSAPPPAPPSSYKDL
ncbi:Aste57867_12949 [Aphanomyces stellatus]|uniref:Aste57867_12949 protein n=1 Tax=Aphanomyces stellatus TaxID=120398 RepID=A0A485KWX4_9STRA|nr:hypothetical protein As57867_012901 [Aphanomyces stellatus]VFT89795.1 Aste57867_12949 [Aphanomyces stellatus]